MQNIKIIEGVDPALVFRVRCSGRLTPDAWTRRGLELLAEGQEWDYVVLSPGAAMPSVRAALTSYAKGDDKESAPAPLSSFFGWLDAIEPYGPSDRLPDSVRNALTQEPQLIDVFIWPADGANQARHRVNQVVDVIDRLSGTVVATDPRPRSPIVRARLTKSAVVELSAVPVIEIIRPPAVPYVDPSDWRDVRAEDLPVEHRDGPPIGVLDDAIASGHPLLRDIVNARLAFPAEHPAWQQPGEHGTMVAGLAAYGDFERPLRDKSPLVAAGSLIQGRIIEPNPNGTSAHRFPTSQPEHLTIEEAIVTLHEAYGVRVFALCVTEIGAYAGPRVSLLTERLDDLIRERDLIIVVPTGNHNRLSARSATMASGHHVADDYPHYALDDVARVAEPATAALTITVGSIARSDGSATLAGTTSLGDKAVAPTNGLSPFSRSGPGVAKSVKPDVAHYGGNLVVRKTGEVAHPEHGTSVVSLQVHDTGRLFGTGCGTSYAAPRVARLAADIVGTYPDATSNLVRALIGLSARVPEPVSRAFGADALRVAGYGLPQGERATASIATRAVLMGEFTIGADTVAIHPLPIPQSFRGGRAARSIRIALAFDPPVRRTRREYLGASMRFDLLRACSIEEVADLYQRQDPDDPLKLPNDRRRLDLKPGTNATGNSALVVREVRRKEFFEDDGDTYYIVVTHQSRSWASTGDQRYALAVALEQESRQGIDLYAELQQRIRPRVRIHR